MHRSGNVTTSLFMNLKIEAHRYQLLTYSLVYWSKDVDPIAVWINY